MSGSTVRRSWQGNPANGSGQRLPIPLHLTQAAPVNPLHPNCYAALGTGIALGQ